MFGRTVLIGASAFFVLAPLTKSEAAPPLAKGPTGNDIAAYYPVRAMNLGQEGWAVINCAVTADRAVADCAVVAENPPGFEFGDAALKLSALFRMRDGVPGTRVELPINFRLAAGGVILRDWLAHMRVISAPTKDDVERARPSMFTGAGVVTVRCHVKTGARLADAERGTVYGCKAAKEVPVKAGLANAALSLAPLIKFDPVLLVQGDPSWTVDLDLTWSAKPGG